MLYAITIGRAFILSFLHNIVINKLIFEGFDIKWASYMHDVKVWGHNAIN